MISESLPGTLEVPRKSQIRESFGPVQRNAVPAAPTRAPAMISKVGDLGGAGGWGGGGALSSSEYSSCKKASSLGFLKPYTARFQ